MFVVKPLMEDADLRAFLSLAAASEYAETGVFQDCGCEQSEIHFVDGAVTADEAVAAVKDGLSEKRTIVHRRMSPDEIEVARLDALAERELGPQGRSRLRRTERTRLLAGTPADASQLLGRTKNSSQ
jgi:hypothetical protein